MNDLRTQYQDALHDFKSGQNTRAAEKLEKIIAQDPSFEDAYEALTVIYYNEKKYDDAIRFAEAWIRLNPDAVMAHTNLSRCFVAKGMIAEAEKAQGESRRLSWKEDLKSKKAAPTKPDLEEKIKRYREIIDFDPKDVLGYYSLGSVYLESENFRDAADIFEKAVETDPSHSASYLGFGSAVEALGDKSKAREIYQRGIKTAENNGDMIPLKKMQARLAQLE